MRFARYSPYFVTLYFMLSWFVVLDGIVLVVVSIRWAFARKTRSFASSSPISIFPSLNVKSYFRGVFSFAENKNKRSLLCETSFSLDKK